MHSLFLLLNQLLEKDDQTLNSTGSLYLFSGLLLDNVLLNNIVWKPGRKAMAIRDLAVRALLQLLQKPASSHNNLGLFQLSVLQEMFEKKILPHITSALEEDIIGTRQASLLILDILFASPLEIEGIPLTYVDLPNFSPFYSFHDSSTY
jgi:hypothetical protein